MAPSNIVNLRYVFDPGDLERSKFKIPLPTIFAPLWVLTLCQVWFGLVENCDRSLNLSENCAKSGPNLLCFDPCDLDLLTYDLQILHGHSGSQY